MNGESSIAMAAGINLMLVPDTSINLARLGALSPDGHSKTFEASANGYARGEGCIVYGFARTADAMRSGQQPKAVMLGETSSILVASLRCCCSSLRTFPFYQPLTSSTSQRLHQMQYVPDCPYSNNSVLSMTMQEVYRQIADIVSSLCVVMLLPALMIFTRPMHLCCPFYCTMLEKHGSSRHLLMFKLVRCGPRVCIQPGRQVQRAHSPQWPRPDSPDQDSPRGSSSAATRSELCQHAWNRHALGGSNRGWGPGAGRCWNLQPSSPCHPW